MIGTPGIIKEQLVEPTWFTIAGKEHYEKNHFKKCLCELSVMRVGGCGFQCVDFLFEFRAERGALDSGGARGLSGQATVLVPCRIFHAPYGRIRTLQKMRRKHLHQVCRRTGVATRGIKPSVIVAREHGHCTCPRRAARKLVNHQVGVGAGLSASRSSAQLTLEVEIRRGPAQQSTMHRHVLVVEKGATK